MSDTALAIKLPLSYDPQALAKDLAAAEQFSYSTHPLQYHDGSWQVINLIYSGGKLCYDHSGDHGYGEAPPAPTPALDHCPYFSQILSDLPGTIRMARLSALPPGGRILRHYDPIESVDFGDLRLHIPVRTDRRVRFHLGYRRRIWKVGEAWYGDFTFPHSIHNKSPITRVHLIVDLKLEPCHLSWFPDGYMTPQAKQRRARRRALQKQACWYHGRLESLFGVDQRTAQA